MYPQLPPCGTRPGQPTALINPLQGAGHPPASPKQPKAQHNPNGNEGFGGTGLPGSGFVLLVARAGQTCANHGPKNALGIGGPWDLNNVNGERNDELTFLNN